jgi:hypothetical protein
VEGVDLDVGECFTFAECGFGELSAIVQKQ